MWLKKKRRAKVLLAAGVLSLGLMGCTTSGEQKAEKEEIVIYAASSLTDVMKDIKEQYEQDNDQVKFVMNFAGSKTLRSQIENGAEADIFISANPKHYQGLYEQGYIQDGSELLHNRMVLVVPKDNTDINSLEDLKKQHNMVLAEENVPAGDYARTVLTNSNALYGADYYDTVMKNIVSVESNIRQVFAKVVLGEADSAIVYQTDVTEDVADKVKVIAIPDEVNVIGTYCIGTLIRPEEPIQDSVQETYKAICNSYNDTFKSYGFQMVEKKDNK